MKSNRSLFFCLLLIMMCCIEDYPPPVTNEKIDFLVVDGYINSSTGSVEVKLSRAIPLDSEEENPPELNAQLHIEDTDGIIFPMNDIGNGIYRNDNLITDNNQEYRLKIIRADGREYFSDFVSVKSTPPIDSIVWRPNQFRDGIQILVNTHDDSNNTRYYQWVFEETYEFTSAFASRYKYENDMVVPIQQAEYLNRCWKTSPSTKIIIGSSDQLNSDIIANMVVNEIPVGSQKLTLRYSILVKQRALSKDAYTYWLNLQNTTEDLGGLFDPQPGRVNGNIFNSENPGEPVIGYFDISEIQEKRMFIKNSDLPIDIRSWKDLMGCRLDTVSVDDAGTIGPGSGLELVDEILQGITVLGYTYSRQYCTDCRLQGGTTERPLFW